MPDTRRPDTTFWVDPRLVRVDRLTLNTEESHHLVRVHRASEGTPFTAVDGTGVAYDCEVESIDGDGVTAKITWRRSRSLAYRPSHSWP